MKKLTKILLTIMLFFISMNTSMAYKYEIVDSKEKIYDYTNTISVEDKAEIKGLIDEYRETYNLEMVVVVRDDYDDNLHNLQNYAQDFYDYNDFGVGNTNDGIILVLSYDSIGPVVWISTTGEAIRIYDDNRINNLKSSMSSVKALGKEAIIKKFINEADYYADLGVPASNAHTYIDDDGELRVKRVYPTLMILILSVAVASIVVGILVAKNKLVRKATEAKQYIDKNSINIYERRDQFLHTHTSKTYVPKSSGSSSGGGSSISRGSSGTSHGGGGGRL